MKKINVIFSDNKVKQFSKYTILKEIAQSISREFEKKALIGQIEDKYFNLNHEITKDIKVNFITQKDNLSKEIINNSAILMLMYVLKKKNNNITFYDHKITEEGFYLDFSLEYNLTKKELENIEKEILVEINNSHDILTKESYNTENYKTYLIDGFNFNVLTNYDLVNNSKKIGYIKLLDISGVYLDGDKKNKQVQRIYGYAASSKKELNEFIDFLEQRQNKDHRKIGKEMQLFMFSNLVGPGLALWKSNGSTIRRILERYIIDLEIDNGYQHVYTPVLGSKQLYEKSGHWQHYNSDMFPLMKIDNEEFVLRPMNCPHHMMLYKDNLHSYRDLPIKIGELGLMHRYEKSGALIGLERVRGMCLNDAHIFVAKSQLKEEFKKVLELINSVYCDLNIKPLYYRISLRDPDNTDKYYLDDNMWESSENYLRETLKENNVNFLEAKGEAAFYGPKLDIQVKSAIGHEFTLSTIQLDFLLPEKFDLTFINKTGQPERPVVIHRSIISTMERMICYLIERYEGKLPLWLAPIQVNIIPICNENNKEYCDEIFKILKDNNIRVILDDNNHKLSYKIRESHIKKIPIILTLGKKEEKNNLVTYRIHGQNDSISLTLEEFIEKIKYIIDNKKSNLDFLL